MPRFHDGLVTGDSRFSLVKQRSYPGLPETLRDAYAPRARLAAGAEAKAVRTGPDLGVRIRAGAHGPDRHARRGRLPRGALCSAGRSAFTPNRSLVVGKTMRLSRYFLPIL